MAILLNILFTSILFSLVSSTPPTLQARKTNAITLPPESFSPLIAQKILSTASSIQSPPKYPQYTDRTSGTWQWFSPDTWTTGFFPATLYALNKRSTELCDDDGNGGDKVLKETDWLALGRKWSAAEVPLEMKTGVGHDVGFLSFPFLDELEVNPTNQTAITAVNNFAKALAARYNSVVIIDNMMNLEVLFASADLTGNDNLRQIAISHARTTAVNHLRPDGSSFHVVDYNSTTGKVFQRRTSQGYSDSSTWSRGQAWGIYGFANMYRRTHLSEFLDTARHMAAYFINNIPQNGIVPWDFNAPLDPSPRPADTSAAMIAATGFIMLAQQESQQVPSNQSGADLYLDVAVNLIKATTKLAWRPSWQSLLSNGTVNNPAKNNLTGIVYGDYYYIRAANELVSMGLASCQ